MSRIVVVDHGAGNLVSIARGLEHAGASVEVLDSPRRISGADGLVLPGVGTTSAAMERLEAAGWVAPLREWDRPLLGICVGLQLFFDTSEENGGSPCLGLLGGSVRRLPDAPLLPHIGWNDVETTPHPIFDGIVPSTPFYFVHSYAPVPAEPSTVIGTTGYGSEFAAAVASGNLAGVQFHPERSGDAGLRILANFVAWCRHAA